MKVLLKFIRYAGLVLFVLSILLLLATILNFFVSFTDMQWMQPIFIRLYLFFAVTGILAYILVRFRRRK
ncbi:hypothetical protein [Metaplanococcus flavidus]|uniref:Uncharacterized protein n=1 Tax=Metaplanococcus flavidus TaxID=569883 RepID=A0ABW3L5Z3_9BACL